jgi:hypothetical protein
VHATDEGPLPDSALRNVCIVMVCLGDGCDGGPLRIQATAERTLEWDDYLADVAENFREETGQSHQRGRFYWRIISANVWLAACVPV